MLIIIVIGGAVYWALNQGYLDNTPLAKLKQDDVDLITQDVGEQTKILGERAKKTGEHIQQVLGESVKVNEAENDQALHEKAFDYGRYIYCKQVVEEYDNARSYDN